MILKLLMGETSVLAGGFNPSEKYIKNISQIGNLPSRGENNKYLKPPPESVDRRPVNGPRTTEHSVISQSNAVFQVFVY